MARWLREGVFVWEGYQFVSIGDTVVSTGFMTDPEAVALKVDPGKHLFVIAVRFN